MGRVKGRWTRLTAWTLTAALIALPATAHAQSLTPGSIPGVGGMTSASSQPITNSAPGQTTGSPAPDYESVVSFIDSAIPVSQVKLVFDANYDNRRPTRAEYLFSKSGVPGSPGWWVPEKSVDDQELMSYIEIAYEGMLSGFLQLPTRWVNPDVNANDWGMADIQGGIKFAFLNTPGLSTAVEIRGTFPTRSGPGLSTSHYSVEPGFLLYLQPLQWLTLEGEARYWAPLSGTDFAGDIARYGLGFSFGERSYESAWVTPVVEVIGWSVLGGKEMVPMPEGGIIRSAAGDTIVNAIAGIRFGLGDSGDIYFGYGRSLTGDAWAHEFWRLEFRVKF